VWHEFAHTPDTIVDGDTGDRACDHYHRWADDVRLMHDLGLGAYRFSLRWSRILPDGVGRVNQAGLDFYDRLVDALLAAGIEPFITLFHWDLPAALNSRGGWSNRDIAEWFAEYAAVAADKLGDRVHWWMTLNEPLVVAEQGHLLGAHAPGVRNIYATGDAVHNQLRAHVAACHALKAQCPDAAVGLALHNIAVWPASDSDEDVAAAAVADAWHNYPLFLEPLVHGRYPAEIEQILHPYLPREYEDDMAALQLPPDFVGMNYYFGYLARHDPSQWNGVAAVPEPEMPRTAMDWIVRPEGIHAILTAAHARYHIPVVFITENGAAYEDHRNGATVHDPERVAYIESHVDAVLRAKAEGVPVRGYFVWSLLDNFEWALGYSKRFGIVYVDFETGERIVKDSGHRFAQLASGGQRPVATATPSPLASEGR
jgi:beta-glucosidase